MTLKEAIQKIEAETGLKVKAAGDCNDRWAIFFEEDRGHLDGFPVFVFKADGYCTGFMYSQYYDLLHGRKPVKLND